MIPVILSGGSGSRLQGLPELEAPLVLLPAYIPFPGAQ